MLYRCSSSTSLIMIIVPIICLLLAITPVYSLSSNQLKTRVFVKPVSGPITDVLQLEGSSNNSTQSIQTLVKGQSEKQTGLTSSCPAECTCTLNSNPRSIDVLCAGKGLQRVPDGLKNLNMDINSLNLENNDIKSINWTLIPTSSLVSLNLSGNQISNLPDMPLVSFGKLRILKLAGNKLEDVKVFTNQNITSNPNNILNVLDLSNNRIQHLPAGSFSRVPNLQDLNLSGNQLKDLGEMLFSTLRSLTNLNLNSNGNETHPLHLDEDIFDKNDNLKSLDLSNSHLIEVPAALRKLKNLERLILDQNDMTSLRQSDLINRKKLVQLSAINCKNLTQIDDHAFGDMQNLKILNLSNNKKLKHISKDAFKPTPKSKVDRPLNLTVLELTGNNLTSLSNLLEPPLMVRFNVLFLNENPLNCDCQLKWLLDLPMEKISSVHCDQPKDYKGIDIRNIPLQDICHESHGYAKIIITLILLICLGAIVAFLIQKGEFCRRLLWRDQYGTIYYTKASFPQET